MTPGVAINKQLVDGSQDLSAQELDLNGMEQLTAAKVISYSKKQASSNEAVLQDVPIGQQPGPLILRSVVAGADPTAVVASQTEAGKVLEFQGTAYVSGKEQLVLGFR